MILAMTATPLAMATKATSARDLFEFFTRANVDHDVLDIDARRLAALRSESRLNAPAPKYAI